MANIKRKGIKSVAFQGMVWMYKDVCSVEGALHWSGRRSGFKFRLFQSTQPTSAVVCSKCDEENKQARGAIKTEQEN